MVGKIGGKKTVLHGEVGGKIFSLFDFPPKWHFYPPFFCQNGIFPTKMAFFTHHFSARWVKIRIFLVGKKKTNGSHCGLLFDALSVPGI